MQHDVTNASKQRENLANPAAKCHAQKSEITKQELWNMIENKTRISISDPSTFGSGWPWGAGGKKTTKTTKTIMLIIQVAFGKVPLRACGDNSHKIIVVIFVRVEVVLVI